MSPASVQAAKDLSKVLGINSLNWDKEEVLDCSPLTLAETTGIGKMEKNGVKDIVLSMMRSRDDNLILLCSNLLLCILNKCSQAAIATMDILNCGQSSLMVVKSVISLMVLDPPFRPATIKTLHNLLLKTFQVSGIQSSHLSADDNQKLRSALARSIGRYF